MNQERRSGIPQPTGGPGITRFARRGGQRLSYESSGAENGIPVLALHDLLADRGQLRALAEAPHDAMFRVTLPDARGHGASPMLSGGGFPARELAADALAVLDAEGLVSVHLASIGWAADTALALAITVPERVTSLVLAAPYLPLLLSGVPEGDALDAGRAHLAMMQEAAAAAEKGQIERALELFLGARVGADWPDRFTKPRLGAIRRAAGSLAPLLTGMAAFAIDRGALESLEVPVTVLIRNDGPSVERDTADALASLLPRSRIAVAPPSTLDQPAPDSDWIEAIARALLAHAA